jgi:hypothetical protein
MNNHCFHSTDDPYESSISLDNVRWYGSTRDLSYLLRLNSRRRCDLNRRNWIGDRRERCLRRLVGNRNHTRQTCDFRVQQFFDRQNQGVGFCFLLYLADSVALG